MNFRQIVQDYFTFSRNERKGITILLVIIFLLAVANKMIFYFETPAKIDAALLNAGFNLATINPEEENGQGSLFVFNPNTIDSLALDSLALPAEIKRNVIRYREKGGHYYSARDFKKMYGMTDSIFRLVEPFIRIENVTTWQDAGKTKYQLASVDIEKKEFSPSQTKPYKEKLLIELNNTDSVELMKLPGIGRTLSKRIIKYRDLLGGFYTFEQLQEVYGLKEPTIDQIQGMISVDVTKIHKIDLNFSDRYELGKHPYIGKVIADRIVNFRTRYGKISDPTVLRDSMVIGENEYERLKPYL